MSSKNEDVLKNLESLLVFDSEKDKLELEAELLHLKFVKVVENLMEHKGMTKAELARKLSTSKSYITQLFSGNKLLNMKTLAKFENALNFNFKISADNRKPNFIPFNCEKFKQPFNLDLWDDKVLGNSYELTKSSKKIKLIA